MAGINPFRPRQPIDPTLFVGRAAEIERLAKYLQQTKAGNAASFMVTGERGIGKSSLLLYIKALAEDIIRVDERSPVRFLVIDTDIDRQTSALGLVEKIQLSLEQNLAKSEEARAALTKAWEFLRQVEVMGLKLKTEADVKELEERALESFAYSLAETVERLCDPKAARVFDATYDGVLVLIDECDSASPLLSLGTFLKNLTERLARRRCGRLMFGLGGLPNLREVLRQSHPSSLRIFDELFLERLTRNEVQDVISLSLRRATRDNSCDYKITEDAGELLVDLSEGIPHFIQQFGSAAFDADTDFVISHQDVLDGALQEHGAIAQIGFRYFEDWYATLGVQDRRVLEVVSASGDLLKWTPRSDLLATLSSLELSAVETAIESLLAGGLIMRVEVQNRTAYRIVRLAMSLWIAQQVERKRLNAGFPGQP